MSQNQEQPTIEEILAGLAGRTTSQTKPKEQPFTNYTMYTGKDVYIGNYSMPDNFSDVTKASVLAFFEKKGIKLLTPGATRKDISIDDLE
jgi:hypothetical protein